MPSRPILQACAKSVGPSPSICSASAANVGFVFVLLQRVAHALGVGEGCAVTASYPEVRRDHHHANSFRTAPSLCADMIFGKDSHGRRATSPICSNLSFRTRQNPKQRFPPIGPT